MTYSLNQIQKNMVKIVIVVPFYKNKLDPIEKISLIQLFKVLSEYPICLIVPESLDLYLECTVNGEYFVERFPDSYFVSAESYSNLCMSKGFYERFLSYDFMLIYQLDAFVFSDRLMEFAEMGYDYIGAALRSDHWDRFHVGNGGLSLRSIQRTLQIVEKKNEISDSASMRDLFERYEDLFFGYCAYKESIDYIAAPIEIANKFSVEDDSCGGFRAMNEDGLPFGTHRFVYSAYRFWKPVIEAYGYSLPSENEVYSYDALETDRKERLIRFIPEWFLKRDDSAQGRFRECCGLKDGVRYKIWGAGHYGRKCAVFLKEIGISIDILIDINADNNETYEGIPVIRPTDELIRNSSAIIIAVKEGYEDISDTIFSYSPNTEVLSYFEIIDIACEYIEKESPGIEGITSPYTIQIKGGVCGKSICYP